MRFPNFFNFLLPILLLTLPARAADIVILQGAPLQVYESARTAFLAELSAQKTAAGPKHIIAFETETLFLAEFKDARDALTAIERHSPRLLLTIGQASLEAADGLPDTPTVFVLAANPVSLIDKHAQLTGVSLDISPGRQLDLFLSRFSFKRTGLIYNEKMAADFVAAAKKAAERRGLQLEVRQVDHVKEAPGMLKSMADKIDSLWLIPDTTVLTPSTMEYLAYFSLKYKLPIFSFSEKLLEYGATAAAVFDIEDMGRQAAHLAFRILEGVPVSSLAVQEPEKVSLVINDAVARNLGLNGAEITTRMQDRNSP